MPTHLKRCTKCMNYTISEANCKNCNSPVENVYPPRFSLQDKYQDYRMEHFRKKMHEKFPDLKK
ncbi:nucleolar RNA-binding Nop10p family protein [Candidatus Lokiarchaeum ossiferum]